MVKDYRDITSLDTEDNGDEETKREFPQHQPRQQRACSGRRLIFFLLGLLCLLAILTMAFGFSGQSFHTDLSALKANVKSFNLTIVGALASLKEKETKDEKRLVKVDQMVKNLTEEVKEAKTQFQDQVSKLQTSIHALNCNLENVKHNRTGSQTSCCPKGWLSFRQSCYWFSNSEAAWEEAKLDCQEKNSKLVTISGYLEQQFVAQHAKQRNTWIGLTFAKGSWKWLDGTTYSVRRIDWRPQELYDISHYSDSDSDLPSCVHLYRDGLWSKEHCTYQFNWVCEMVQGA